MDNILHTTADLCLQLDQPQRLSSVEEVLRRATHLFGVTFFMFGMRTGKNISPPEQIVLSSYPKRWQAYYDGQQAHRFDPIFNFGMAATGPFRWEGRHVTPEQRALREMSVNCGMEFGFSCTDRGADGSIAMLSLCGGQPIAQEPMLWKHTSTAVSMLTGAIHRALIRLTLARIARADLAKEPLSESELKAIAMTASSMTAKEVAKVLGVQRGTVHYYLDRAAVKFGVATHKEAITKALAEGIVDVRNFPKAGFTGNERGFDN